MLEVGAFAEREKDLADVVLQVIVNSNMEKVQKWKGSERITFLELGLWLSVYGKDSFVHRGKENG